MSALEPETLRLDLSQFPLALRLQYRISYRLGSSRAVFLFKRLADGGFAAELSAEGRLLLVRSFSFRAAARRRPDGSLVERSEETNGRSRTWRDEGTIEPTAIAVAETPLFLAAAYRTRAGTDETLVLAGSKSYAFRLRTDRTGKDGEASVHDRNASDSKPRAIARVAWSDRDYPAEIALHLPAVGEVRAALEKAEG